MPTSIIASTAVAFEWVAAVLIVLIFVSSVDDLFIDVRYWGLRLLLVLGLRRPDRVPTPAALRARPERRMAILVPAWQESDVIDAMLQNTLATLEYEDYTVFVGTYPNDPATGAKVDAMAARHGRIRRVEVPHPGPTCKADCLNHVIAAAFREERRTERDFEGFVLHDSEDVLHPLELKFFSALLADLDMIQLPVVALERKWHQLIAGTYMDEFAEAHGKDMVVRQDLCGSIPSAGVGTCFSRRAVLALGVESDGAYFCTDSLTEDYEIGMRLAGLGFRAGFLLTSVADDAASAAKARNGRRGSPADEVVAVREFFPSRLRSAYRQRARWMLGIGLQAWSQVPLRGRTWREAYLILHDRKGVVTSFVPAAAYLWVVWTLAFEAGFAAGLWPAHVPQVLRPESVLLDLLAINLALVAVRAVQRAYFTGRLYGGVQGAMAVPRMVAGNVLNCLAAARAWRLYLAHRITGKPLAWDKTSHEYPVMEPVPRAVPAGPAIAPAKRLHAAPAPARLAARTSSRRERA